MDTDDVMIHKHASDHDDERRPLIASQHDIQRDKLESPPPAYTETPTNLHAPPAVIVTARHWLVWPVCFLFMSAFNMTLNAFPQYLYIKLQEETFPGLVINTTTSKCEMNTSSLDYLMQLDVQQIAAKWGIYYYMAGGITTIASSFILGSLTDRYGRKFLFVVPCVGSLVRTVAAHIGVYYNLPLYYYAFFYFLEGISGQTFTMLQIGYIYAADITQMGKQRSIGIVAIEVAFGLGTCLPSLAVGYILKLTNSFIVPFYISEGMLVMTLILIYFLPETYPKELRGKRKYTSKFDNLKDSTGLFFSKKNKGRRWMYSLLLAVFIFTAYDLFGRLSMEGLYLLNAPFCWNPEKIGVFNALRSGFQQIIGMALVIMFHICLSDEMIAVLGCVSYGASFFMEGLAQTDLVMYLVTGVGAIGLLTIPMVRSIMSQMTSPDKQGAVFAAISAAETSTNLIAAVSANSIYMATVKSMRGFTFLLFGVFNVISLFMMLFFTVVTKNSQTKYYRRDMEF